MTKKASNIIVIVALILVVVIGLVVALLMSDNSSEHIMKAGDYEFVKKGDIVKVSKYTNRDGVTEIEIPEMVDGFKVTAIGAGAFKGNDVITKVTMKDNITLIEESAFENCTKLTTVKMTKVTDIGKAAFKGAKELSFVEMPESLERIGDEAFMDAERFNKFDYKLNSDYTITSALAHVGKDAFKGSQLMKILIPSSMKTIGEGAFRGANLSQIFFYEGVENIGDEAFLYDEHCNRNMQVYTFNPELEPEEAPTLDTLSRAFNDNALPASLRTIGKGAFEKVGTGYAHLNLNSIEFGENLVSIGDRAFIGASAYFVSFKNKDTLLGKYAFSDLYTQVEFKLPANTKTISEGLFYGTNLKNGRNMEIPASVEEIGIGAFSGSEINYDITFVPGSPADTKYQYYKSSDFRALMSKDGKILYSVIMGSGSKQFNIPATVEVIETYAFSLVGTYDENATSLKINIPDNVREIKKGAFSDSDITVIKLNHTDETPIKIDSDAFKNIATKHNYTVQAKSGSTLYTALEEQFKGVSNVSINTLS